MIKMICRNKWMRHVMTSMLAICLVAMLGITSFAKEATATTTLNIKQEFTVKNGKKPSVGAGFYYKLTPIEAGIPMPKGTIIDDEYYFTLEGVDNKEISIEYSHAGVYQYQLEPIITEEYTGYVYDKSIYVVKVYVKNKNDGLMAVINVYNQKNEKVEEILYKNSYEIPLNSAVDNIKTGDTSLVYLYGSVCGMSCLLILLILYLQKERQETMKGEI